MYIPGGGLVRLRESIDALPESEVKIAEYILAHPAELIQMTVSELAQYSGGSPAAVVRLWKSLGFDSYQDFKFRVASDLQSNAVGEYSEIQAGSSFGAVVHSLEDNLIQSIQNTFRLLKESDVEEAVSVLVQSTRIVTFGVGASAVVAKDLTQKLQRVGLLVQEAVDYHTAATLTAQLSPADVLVIVSYSGQTSDTVEVAQIGKDRGAHVLAITRFGDTALSRFSTTCLHVSSVEPKVRVAATASRISALAIVDTLFIYLANHFNTQVYKSLESSRNAVKSHKLE